MRDYLWADAYRMPRYLPLWTGFAIALALYLGATYLISGPAFTPETYASVLAVFGSLLPLVAGLSLVGFVYSHDVRAGAMKVAIGRGVSRRGVVGVKTVELLTLTVLGLGLLFVLCAAWDAVLGLDPGPAPLAGLLGVTLAATLQLLIYGLIAGCVAFARQETTASTTVFALLASGVFEVILGLVLSQDAVVDAVGDLSRFLPRNLTSELGHAWATGDPGSFLGFTLVAGYLLLPVLLTRYLFDRTELDF